MTHQEFTAWLQGYLDAKDDKLSEQDVQTIRLKMILLYPQMEITPYTPQPNPYNPYSPTVPNPWTITYKDGYITNTNNDIKNILHD